MTILWENRIVKRADVPPDQLLANPKNYRRHTLDQKAAFRALVAEVGYIDPVLCQLDDTVIDGHLRVEVALEDGIATIPVDYYDGTDEQADLILATKDPLAAMAYHDDQAAAALLDELGRDHDAALLSLLDSIRAEPPPHVGLTDPDAIPAAPEPITKPGDLWTLGRHRLLCGDATNAADVARLMDGERADMVFTDPPYGVDYDGGAGNDVKRPTMLGDQHGIYREWLDLWRLYATEQTAFYIWFADRAARRTYAAVEDAGLSVRALIVWNKTNAHYGAYMAQYMQKHEPCLYCHIGAPNWYGPTNEVTVWDVEQPARNDLHPVQKPVELAERAIGNSSRPDDLILDLFGGSGSTLIACEQTGRRCAMLEIDPHYCDVIVTRWEHFTGQTATRTPALHETAAD